MSDALIGVAEDLLAAPGRGDETKASVVPARGEALEGELVLGEGKRGSRRAVVEAARGVPRALSLPEVAAGVVKLFVSSNLRRGVLGWRVFRVRLKRVGRRRVRLEGKS